MNALEWVQFIAGLTATLLSSVHPENHTPALIAKTVGTAKTILDNVQQALPPALANPALPPAQPVQQPPAPVPAPAIEIDYDKLAAAIAKQTAAPVSEN